MDYEALRVFDLRKLASSRKLIGFSTKSRGELLEMLHNSDRGIMSQRKESPRRTGYAGWNLKQLRLHAKNIGVIGFSNARKDEVIAMIMARERTMPVVMPMASPPVVSPAVSPPLVPVASGSVGAVIAPAYFPVKSPPRLTSPIKFPPRPASPTSPRVGRVLKAGHVHKSPVGTVSHTSGVVVVADPGVLYDLAGAYWYRHHKAGDTTMDPTEGARFAQELAATGDPRVVVLQNLGKNKFLVKARKHAATGAYEKVVLK